MPKAHRAHQEWSPSRLVRWGATIGPETETLVEQILASRPHPEQGYRSCLGLLRLAKRYGPARLNAACARAVAVGARSYRHVDSMLRHGLDQQPLLPEAADARPVLTHANVRGPAYYHEGEPHDDDDPRPPARAASERHGRRLRGAAPGRGTSALGFDERFSMLVDAEQLFRDNRALTRRLKEAKLRLPQACLEDLDYAPRRGLDRAVIRQLALGRWIVEHHNMLITGATGVGKTFLACALGQQACRQGHRVIYRRLPRLFADLAIAHADGSYIAAPRAARPRRRPRPRRLGPRHRSPIGTATTCSRSSRTAMPPGRR